MRILLLLAALAWAAPAAAGEALTLDECLALAAKNNPELKLARQDVAAARGEKTSAVSAFLPQLQFKGAAQRQSPDSFASSLLASQVGSPVKRSNEMYHLGLELEQPIYMGGYGAAQYGFSKAQLARADSGLVEKDLAVAIDVTGAFYDILGLEKKIDALREASEFMAGHVKTVRAQVRERVALKTSLLSAEVAGLSAKRDLLKAQNALQLARRRFNGLLGRPAEEEVRLAGELSAAPLEADAGKAGPRVDAHPAVQAARSSVEMGEFAVGMAKAEMYRPRLKLMGNYNLTEDKWMPRKDDWNVTLGLEIPIFTTKPFGRVKKYEAELAKAKTGLDLSKERVSLEIQGAWLDFSQAREALELTEKGEEQAQEYVRVCNLGYGGGTITNEQLLDARRELVRASLENISTLCEYNRARARLKYHLGLKEKK